MLTFIQENTNLVIALIAALLGAPFLNFLLSLFRARADRNSVVATGASTAVTAMQMSIENLRLDLVDARQELDEARTDMDRTRMEHLKEMRELRRAHRLELEESEARQRALADRLSETERKLEESKHKTDELCQLVRSLRLELAEIKTQSA